ncbi:aspartyl/asparaginyl beta-hydroxylase domain-containing protein [Flavicella sp.]|uniref:aspartyl/asparaginyl beta-hydroxylase domain-containing protein n=1 Tax=Flavicella sp. TaxID=2957742 RepID=UPI002614EF8A|nr:aspartyl/asparaginyl beta-hydroxylase domain-containing protein [Flavicella sp.]MDG1804661.1 aspartyl/asparaginyl beta-hydroxylase domain-containing protein [Flavicella sp.]
MKEKIKKISISLTEEGIGYLAIQEKIHQIHETFKLHTPITGAEEEVRLMAAIPTANGMALGLTHAAQCLLDYKRTEKLLKGIVKAIKDVQQKREKKVVEIFYAGCGPYAPFITLVAPLFEPKEVQFTLLDINQESIKSAKTLIENLGLSLYVKQYLVEDAITYQFSNLEVYDILFSETLDAMLYRESYVPILINLTRQFSEETIVIPENVTLHATIFDVKNSDLPVLSKEIFNTRLAIANTYEKDCFPSTEILLKPDFKEILIETKVVVYKNIVLGMKESSLTIPYKVLLPQPLNVKKAIFTYFIKPTVELRLDYSDSINSVNDLHKVPKTKTYLSEDRVRLPFSFDAAKLAYDFESLKLNSFEYYKVITLRAPAFEVDDSVSMPPVVEDYADGTWTEWLDTDALKKSSYLNEVIDFFKKHTTVNLVRILRLAPDSTIKEHKDPTLALEEKKSMIRLTIPIYNKDEEFYLNGTVVNMIPGECWYLRLSDPHKVVNKGSSERVNLTIDMIPNKWIRELIDKSQL